ncbi:MAG: hypothetical protein WC602_04455 [archaeon]
MTQAKHWFFGIIIFAAITLLFGPVQRAFFGIVKYVFEGNSLGKMYLFLGFAAVFFLFLWLRGKKNYRRKNEGGHIYKYAAIVGAMFVLSLFLQGFLIYSYNAASQSAAITVLSERNGFLEWESSYLQHTHTGKIAFGLISQAIPVGAAKVDSGAPMFSIIPFAPFFAIIFLALMIAAIYFAFREARRIYDGTITPDILVWLVLSFQFILFSMDGGLFTLGMQSAIALGAYYCLRHYSKHHFSALEQFVYPLLITGGFQFALSYVFSANAASSYGLPMAGILLALATIFNNRDNPEFNWKAWAVFGLILVAAAGDAYIGFAVGRILFPEKQADMLIYGLPESVTQTQLENTLSGRLEIIKIEKIGNIATVSAMPKSLYAMDFLAEDLRRGLNPEGYLYVVPMQRSEGLVKIVANVPIDSLLDVKSEFVSFEKTEYNGKIYLGMHSEFNKVYAGFWVLNYLRYEKGVKGAVVVTS